MKKYYFTGTNDELKFGDYFSAGRDKVPEGCNLLSIEGFFNKSLVPLLLSEKMIEEREKEEVETNFNFQEKNSSLENLVDAFLETAEEIEKRMEELEDRLTDLEGILADRK